MMPRQRQPITTTHRKAQTTTVAAAPGGVTPRPQYHHHISNHSRLSIASSLAQSTTELRGHHPAPSPRPGPRAAMEHHRQCSETLSSEPDPSPQPGPGFGVGAHGAWGAPWCAARPFLPPQRVQGVGGQRLKQSAGVVSHGHRLLPRPPTAHHRHQLAHQGGACRCGRVHRPPPGESTCGVTAQAPLSASSASNCLAQGLWC